MVKNIEKNRLKSKILVKLPTLKYMVRGGRISPVKGLIAKFINLKPIVSLDENGESVIPGKSLSSKRTHKMILEMVRKEMEKGKLKYYAIVYGIPHEEVDIFEEELKKITGVRPLFKKPISPIIGLHAGPRTFAVATMRE